MELVTKGVKTTIAIGNVDTSLNSTPRNREHKGKSTICLPLDYSIVDVETTGLDFNYCEIIEVAALKVRNGEVVERFSSLVRPEYEVDDFIAELTGITNEMLESAPTFSEISKDFYNFLSDDVLIGYNVNFDVNFLYDAFLKNGLVFSNDFIDLLRIARKTLPDLKHHTLSDMVRHYKILREDEHRALPDCIMTQKCYECLKATILEEYTEETFILRFKKTSQKNVIAQTTDFDETNPIYGKTVVFTGALSCMQRRDAMQIVANLGGINGDNVTKKTNFLVIGSEEFASSVKDGKTTKMKKAEGYILKGCELSIISESAFFDMINQ